MLLTEAILMRIMSIFLLFCLLGLSHSAFAQRLPQGSYTQSCQQMRVQRQDLFGVCLDRRGNARRTRLERALACPGDIANINGNLRCMPPTDSYVRTCRQVSARNDVLRATCQRRNGRWQATQLRNFRRHLGRINNCDGTLTPRRC